MKQAVYGWAVRAAMILATGLLSQAAGAADGPPVINVNYAGGANPGNAWMNGMLSGDASARGSASRVAPAAYGGSVWNDFNESGVNSASLKDSTGRLTGIGLTTSMAAGPWNDWTGLGTCRMLVSGLIAGYSSYTTVLSLTGLNAAHTYTLYIASLHNTGNQTSTFRAGGVEKALTYTSVSDWTEGKTHVQVTGLTPAAGGTLTVEAKSTGELVLNGFQLIDTTPEKELLSLAVPGCKDAAISGTNVLVTVPYGTPVTALAPICQVSYGATCAPASGVTNNFSAPVSYTVTASDGSKKVYAVAVAVMAFPDPEFTLQASTALWDGRQAMTVTTDIANWGVLQALGATNLTYAWSVAGVAAGKLVTPGTLTLLRAQGSGLMRVTLVLSNGGYRPVTNSVAVTVQEPASEAWVQRTPGAAEKPVSGQFFARDDTGFGKIFYTGTLAGSPDTVYLKVTTNGPGGADLQYGATLRQALAGGAYAFTAPVAAGLFTYKVVFGSTTGGSDTPLATVTNLVCGDAYLIDGQSNAEAATPNNGTPPEANYYSSGWIRCYGNYYTGTTNGGWGTALRARTWGSENYGLHQIGAWGIDIASNLLAKYSMPICIINGAVGGTRIDQHVPNPAGHYAAGGSYSIYANLLNRVAGAKLTHGIRGVLWHQGEQDQGREGPYGGDFDYKWYQQNFVDISAAWKQDYPNIKNYYVFQIWPAACGDTSANDLLREQQRTLPHLYSNLRVMSTLGIVPGSGCHYELAGYQKFSDLMSPLVEQDNYGFVPDTGDVYTAPDLKRAYFTSTNRTEIALEFGQDMAWNNASAYHFYLDGAAGKVASGSVSGKVIKLQLTAASAAQTITYLHGIGWDYVQANLLYGANGIAALTFAEVPVAASADNANRAPVAVSQSVRTAQDTAKSVTLAGSDEDGDPLTYAVVSAPAHGSLSGTPPNVTYTPPTGYAGPDSFTFKVMDLLTSSVPATVSVTMTGRVTGAVLAEDFEHEWSDNALADTANSWTFGGSGALSSITNPAAGYAALPGRLPFPLSYDHTSQKRCLALNNPSGPLQTPAADASFANAKETVDLMVNFAAGATLPTSPAADMKAAVYLKADGATTNLYVFHGQKAGAVFGEPLWTGMTNRIAAGVWYRMTLVFESLDGVNDAEAFRVYINGQALQSADAAYSDTWKGTVFMSPYTPDGGSWFLSAARRSASTGASPSSIGYLAFQGTGLIDDLVVTSCEPSFSSGTVFMLALADGRRF